MRPREGASRASVPGGCSPLTRAQKLIMRCSFLNRFSLGSACLTFVLSSAGHAQLTASLAGNSAAASVGPVTLAGDMIDNVFVPRTGNSLTIAPAVPPQNLGTFDIVINPGAGLMANPAALAAFNRAAASWEARIFDPITITLDGDLAALGAGILGSASAVVLQASYTTIRDAMVTDGADEPDDAITAFLPTSAQFTANIPPMTMLSSNLSFSKANAKALGFPNLDQQFGVSDEMITFSTGFSFDFDNSDGVGAGMFDFETVAAHEIGHALGFFSIVDSVNAGATTVQSLTLDLFRFANDTATDPTTPVDFSTFPRDLIPGTDAITDEILGLTPERRMSTGVTNAAFPGTDGRQASHWKDDILTGVFIGLLDPTLSPGISFGPQDSDFRAIDLIGYDITPTPIPEPSTVFAAVGLLGFAAWRGRRRARASRS